MFFWIITSEHRSHRQEAKGLPEKSVKNIQYSLRYNLEDWRLIKSMTQNGGSPTANYYEQKRP